MPSVFITGADGGLGLSLCKTFVDKGWSVYAGCFTSDAIAQPAERFTCVPLDVRSLDSVRAAAETVSQHSQSLDLLINNAGINPAKLATLEELDFELISETLDVNTVGPLRAVQQFLPLLRKGTGKRIANISSEAGTLTDCQRDAWYGYAGSKSALNRITKILRNYLRPEGFDVCSIHPGWMRSGMGPDEATYSTDEIATFLFPLIVERENTDDDWLYDYQGKPLAY